MQYTNLGRTGLKVSRICLGMMTYGTSKWRDWVLDEDASRPFIQRALELGINFFDTADMYSAGVSEEVTGRALRDFAAATRRGHRHQGLLSHERRPQRPRPVAQAHHGRPSTSRCAGWAWTTSTSTRSTAGITRRPSRRPWRRCTTWSRPGKVRYIGASSMFAWQFAKAQHVADRHGWTPLRHHAEPLQPGLPRGGAGDDPALPGRGRRADPVEPAGAGLPGRQPHQRQERRHHPRQDRRLRPPPLLCRTGTSPSSIV